MAIAKKAPKGAAKGAPLIKRVLNCIPSRETEKDWTFANAAAAGPAMAAAPPASKDLRTGNAWWTIGDQGATGSCVGWATADSVLRWQFVNAGRLPASKTKPLSPRFIWMASKELDEFVSTPTTFIESAGTSLKAALDVARKYGAVEDSVLPFGSGQLYQNDENTFYLIASRLKIANYVNLQRNLADWRRWIASKGPILTRLDVDSTWDNATNTGGNLAIYNPATIRGGHAVALVGYTPTTFIIRNSWGTGWGDKGYAYASIPYASAAFTEAYGVSV